MSKQHFYKRGAKPCDEPLLYRGAGIEGIYLCSGFKREEIDGEWFTRIEDIQGLHNAIGLYLVEHRKALAPHEIRFLRNTMEKTQAEVARVIGVDAQTVARWEKGKSEMPGPADRMLRILFVLSLASPEELQEFVAELQEDGPAELAPTEDKPIMFVRNDEKWEGDAKVQSFEDA
jgi:DNA-binding transcriptional regulator YiaG